MKHTLVLAPLVCAATVSAPTLRADTAVRLATTTELSSETAMRGDPVMLVVRDPVMIDGVAAIPAGTVAVGQIVTSDRKSAFGAGGRIEIGLQYLTLADGRTVRLRGAFARKGASLSARAASANVYAVAFAVAITGKRATIAAGTPVTGYVLRDTAIAR